MYLSRWNHLWHGHVGHVVHLLLYVVAYTPRHSAHKAGFAARLCQHFVNHERSRSPCRLSQLLRRLFSCPGRAFWPAAAHAMASTKVTVWLHLLKGLFRGWLFDQFAWVHCLQYTNYGFRSAD